MRISNFLLWQVAYSELFFTDCLWPDFGVPRSTRRWPPTRSATAASAAMPSRRGVVPARRLTAGRHHAAAARHHRRGAAGLLLPALFASAALAFCAADAGADRAPPAGNGGA
jgi:hypothetical protein